MMRQNQSSHMLLCVVSAYISSFLWIFGWFPLKIQPFFLYETGDTKNCLRFYLLPVTTIPATHLRLATVVFFSLLFHLFNLQSHHYLSSLPHDHILSLPFILIASRFHFCFQPLLQKLLHLVNYQPSLLLPFLHVRLPGMSKCFCPPTYSLKFIRAPLGQSVKFILWPLRLNGGGASSIPQ